MQSLSQKTFDSLQLMTHKLNEFINTFKENGNSEEIKKELINDNIKLKELLMSQIEYSDNFRINTEITLNRIKDEFKTMVIELQTLKKKSNDIKEKEEKTNEKNTTNKKTGNFNNNQKINFSINSINNQGNENNYNLPLKVNLIK